MTQRVDARDVLDADAVTSRAFSARVVGNYRRTGPDAWDDYERVEQDGGPIEVLPETPIQLEDEGVASFQRSFDTLLAGLSRKTASLVTS